MALGVVITMRSMEPSNPVTELQKVLVSGLKKCAKIVAGVLNRNVPASLVPEVPFDVFVGRVVPFLGGNMLAVLKRVNRELKTAITQSNVYRDLIEMGEANTRVEKRAKTLW